ncbi:hypothetical protein CALVIDRAFT_533086 [Calocera viscosa TUFC12733]|uniref:Uncharacterized protein n=1 Tax=Calocera viscosa (strain TUFC12733) TaxID=1330018 RepID=A0A167RBV7_CALVF|nr:hypothetical protein CALVIDRAFT_533086 [Calocera viscosa TUFC12733]
MIIAALSGVLFLGAVGALLCFVWRRCDSSTRSATPNKSAMVSAVHPPLKIADAEKGAIYFIHGPLDPIPEEDVVLSFNSATCLRSSPASSQYDDGTTDTVTAAQ